MLRQETVEQGRSQAVSAGKTYPQSPFTQSRASPVTLPWAGTGPSETPQHATRNHPRTSHLALGWYRTFRDGVWHAQLQGDIPFLGLVQEPIEDRHLCGLYSLRDERHQEVGCA